MIYLCVVGLFVVKKVNLYNALLCPVSKVLRYGPCVAVGSHSFTCHGATQTRTIPAFTPQRP